MKSKFSIAAILFASTFFGSCQREELNEVKVDDMVFFNTMEEFSETLSYVSKLSIEELKKYEDSKGYRSLARETE